MKNTLKKAKILSFSLGYWPNVQGPVPGLAFKSIHFINGQKLLKTAPHGMTRQHCHAFGTTRIPPETQNTKILCTLRFDMISRGSLTTGHVPVSGILQGHSQAPISTMPQATSNS